MSMSTPAGSSLGEAKPAHEVLLLLRRMIRAADLYSRQLVRTTGLTVPQLLVLRAIEELGEVTAGRVSAQVSLSQATVSTILDRLEGRGLIERYRSAVDRRVVHARLTPAGERALAMAPPPLQERFSLWFEGLPASEQALILSALRRVAAAMAEEDGDMAAAAAPAPAAMDF